jgi:hypothetical protein
MNAARRSAKKSVAVAARVSVGMLGTRAVRDGRLFAIAKGWKPYVERREMSFGCFGTAGDRLRR